MEKLGDFFCNPARKWYTLSVTFLRSKKVRKTKIITSPCRTGPVFRTYVRGNQTLRGPRLFIHGVSLLDTCSSIGVGASTVSVVQFLRNVFCRRVRDCYLYSVGIHVLRALATPRVMVFGSFCDGLRMQFEYVHFVGMFCVRANRVCNAISAVIINVVSHPLYIAALCLFVWLSGLDVVVGVLWIWLFSVGSLLSGLDVVSCNRSIGLCE